MPQLQTLQQMQMQQFQRSIKKQMDAMKHQVEKSKKTLEIKTLKETQERGYRS